MGFQLLADAPMPPPNAFYAQSGGVTAVINASACGVIETARRYPERIGTVYAGRNGIVGALTEELIDTGQESAETIAALRSTPSGAFGSCRFKLHSLETHRREYERLLAVFKAHDISYFFYNGGGDSADTCLKVSQLSEAMGYPLQAIHVPKTIDNDLPLTDCSPGFGSAAKYVAISTLEASFDVRSMAATSTKVFVLEVMGRHAGWVAAAAGLPTGLSLVILFPEVAFDRQTFLARVKLLVKQHGYCTVVVSEGAQHRDGSFLAEHGAPDAFGHAQLGGAAPVVAQIVQQALGLKVHWAVASYLQRAARHIASATDVRQAYEVGQYAVELALQGRSAVMPTIERISDAPYVYRLGAAPLEAIANVEKSMPREFISEDGYGISELCRRYLQPLIEGEDTPAFKDGLPVYVTLSNRTVAKRLPEMNSPTAKPRMRL